MNIQATTAHLQRLGQPFDVIIVKNNIETLLYPNCSPTDVEGLLNEVIDTHKPDRLIVQERRRNGSVNVKGSKHEISIGGFASQLPSLNGFGSAQSPHIVNQSIPSDFKDYLLGELKDKNSKLETKVEKLEAENEKLKRDNFEFEKDLKFKDKEFELATRSTELEQSKGLSGIMETVSNNPALANIAAMAIGRLMGVENPLAQQVTEPEVQPESAVNNAPDINTKVAQYVSNWLLKQDETTVKNFFQLMQRIIKDANIITEFLNTEK